MLAAAGFLGWLIWDVLRAGDFTTVPCQPGAYVVLRQSTTSVDRANEPGRLVQRPGPVGACGAPAVGVGARRSRRLHRKGGLPEAAPGGGGATRAAREFGRFGAGEPVSHLGGRLIWQLADSDVLLVAWHAITWAEAVRDYEKRLLAHFAELHNGRRPFANLTG
jgi:hypothetical protein